MATDKWLTTIGEVTQTLFWAIGYYFGFTLVMVFTLGALVPDSFDEIGRMRRPLWQFAFRREGKVYLVAEAVATLGWLLLSGLILAWFIIMAI